MEEDVLTRAQRRQIARHTPGGQRRSPSKSGRRSPMRSPYWTWRAAWREQLQAQLHGKRKRRWFRRAAAAVVHPVQAIRRRDTSARAAFTRGRRAARKFSKGQR